MLSLTLSYATSSLLIFSSASSWSFCIRGASAGAVCCRSYLLFVGCWTTLTVAVASPHREEQLSHTDADGASIPRHRTPSVWRFVQLREADYAFVTRAHEAERQQRRTRSDPVSKQQQVIKSLELMKDADVRADGRLTVGAECMGVAC